jgi:hypothetical protein
MEKIKMGEVILAIFISLLIGFSYGYADSRSDIQEKCVNYYSDMPHNKVEDHCKNLLKFKKDVPNVITK